MMAKFREKSSKQGAIPNVSEKETGTGSANEQLESPSMSPTSSRQPGIWCGLPLPWKRGTGRKKHWAMKKFGFGKKEKSEKDDGDSIRSGLFGRKKPTASQNENPYAQQPVDDQYARMTPYQQAKADLAAGPRGPPAGLPSGPSPSNVYGTPPPSYTEKTQATSGYQPQRYGASGGYGSNRYDAGASPYGMNRTGPSPAPSQGSGRLPARGPGGYGGLGAAEEDHNKDELFTGAKGKYVGQGLAAPSYKPENTGSGLPSTTDKTTGGYGSSGGYGEPHEMTEEELQQQEYRGIKQEIQGIRQETANSTGRSVQLLESMIETATGTVSRLGQQGEMLHNTNRNLDIAASQSRVANEKIDELKTLNRSMFAVHVANPFTKSKREQEALEKHLRTFDSERNQTEETRRAKYIYEQGLETHFRDTQRLRGSGGMVAPRSNPEKSKYILPDDSDEEGNALAEDGEAKIEADLTQISKGLRVVHSLALEQGELASQQNELIDRIGEKSDTVNRRLEVGKYRMAGIR